MKRLILFIAAAVVSVATVQAQSRDYVEIAKIVLPQELFTQQSETAEATPVEEAVAAVEETVVEEVTTLVEETAAVVEETVTAVEEAVVEEATTLVEVATEVKDENPEATKKDVAEIVKAILPADFYIEQSVAEEATSSDLTPIEEIAAYVGEPAAESDEAPEAANVAEIVKNILPADFSIEQYAANSALTTILTPMEQITAYAESESIIKTRFLPMRQRVDRNIGVNKFVYKGECMLGLTASYGNISTEDSDIMLLLNDINIGLRSTTVRPFFAYAYRDNMAVGIRLGYQFIDGSIDNVDLNLGLIADGLEDMSISNLGLRSESFSWALFHRNYLGLDRRGIVGVIIESEILVKSGSSRFTSGGEVVNVSRSSNFAAELNVNPGLGIYIFPQVCVTATVGIGGLRYNNVRQYDAMDNVIGRRDHSSLNFKINITDIQIGVVAHLWNNKKK